MTAKKPPTLQDFAQTQAKPPCHFCTMPERQECDEAVRRGISRRVVLQWLYEVQGYAAVSGPHGCSQTAIEKHFARGHHHADPSVT